MHKIIVNNIINGLKFGARFELNEDMNAWIEEQKSKASWGKGERDLVRSELPSELEPLIIEEYQREVEPPKEMVIYERDEDDSIVIDEDGYPVVKRDADGHPSIMLTPAVTIAMVKLKPEYEITITDVTMEFELEKIYKLRVKAYGSTGMQFDMIYHDGLDAWKAHIDSVKQQYPKPTGV